MEIYHTVGDVSSHCTRNIRVFQNISVMISSFLFDTFSQWEVDFAWDVTVDIYGNSIASRDMTTHYDRFQSFNHAACLYFHCINWWKGTKNVASFLSGMDSWHDIFLHILLAFLVYCLFDLALYICYNTTFLYTNTLSVHVMLLRSYSLMPFCSLFSGCLFWFSLIYSVISL